MLTISCKLVPSARIRLQLRHPAHQPALWAICRVSGKLSDRNISNVVKPTSVSGSRSQSLKSPVKTSWTSLRKNSLEHHCPAGTNLYMWEVGPGDEAWIGLLASSKAWEVEAALRSPELITLEENKPEGGINAEFFGVEGKLLTPWKRSNLLWNCAEPTATLQCLLLNVS